MTETCVLTLVLLVFLPASLSSPPSVKLKEVADKKYEFSLECPVDCNDKVHFALNCTSGILSVGNNNGKGEKKSSREWLQDIEQKVKMLESIVAPTSGSSPTETGRKNLLLQINALEQKVDRLVFCLREQGH